MSELVKVAAIQMSSSNDWGENLKTALELLEQAHKDSAAQLYVLPENFLCFGSFGLNALNLARKQALDSLAGWAVKRNASIVAGSIPFRPSPLPSPRTRYKSRCHFISSEGDYNTYYDKLHLFDVEVSDRQGRYRESDTYEAGEEIVLAPFKSHSIGLSICYDLRFPEFFTKIREQGAELITVPAAFTAVTGAAHWEVLLRARAIETQCFLIAANQCGTHDNKRQTWGHSMIVDPWGDVIAECKEQVGFCSAELDFELLKDVRSKMPVLQHRRFGKDL